MFSLASLAARVARGIGGAFAEGYLVSAGIMLLGLIIAVIAIRIRREDLG